MVRVNEVFDLCRIPCAGVALAVLAACQTTTAPPAEPGLNRYLLAAARNAEAEGDDRAAAAHYRALSVEQPSDRAVALALARSLRRSDAVDEAIERVRAALAAGPDVGLLVELGKLQISAGHANEALAPLAQAVQLAANDPAPLHALGIAYDRLGRYEEAAAHYEQALKHDPGNAALLNNFAMSHALAGRLDRARDLLGRAVALPDAPAQVRANLALLKRLGDQAAEPRRALP